MKVSLKLLAPVAFAVTACSANAGSSNVPGMPGASNVQTHSVPMWKAHHLARQACADAPAGQAQCLALIESGRVKPAQAGWAPTDFQTRYKLPSGTNGSGQIVAIVDAYDNPNAATDLAEYRSNYGLGTANFYKYNQDGQQGNYPQGSYGWGVEIDLDIEMVSAVCPKCTIYLIEANSSNTSDLDTAEAEAVTLGASIVSNSWICYGSSCGIDVGDFDQAGVAYLAASGDYGYGYNGAPEALGSVISVGGTVLSKSGNKYGESVWSDGGGGCADGFAKPSWQHDPDCSSRTDADVSAVAWDVAEYDTYEEGGWFEVGGTSVASPLTAGVIGLAGNASSLDAGSGFWSATQKTRKKDLHYISSGSDGSCGGEYLCQAGTHQYKTYSGPSGWGTPDGIGLY